MDDLLEALRAAHELAPIDLELARGLARLGSEGRPEALLGVALASRAIRQGHVCLDLGRFAPPAIEGMEWPERGPWVEALRRSSLVGGPGDFKPLVLEGERLYLGRYHRHETSLADNVARRVAHLDETLDGAALRKSLDRLFPRVGLGEGEIDHQRRAALVAVARRFCIISGGPGTGKTSTVVKILALLAEQALLAGRTKLHAILVAPTGKAAARLRETILLNKAKLDVETRIREMIPDETSTIHRAMRPLPGSTTRFRHDAENPLPADLVLVDEASMVDLPLMSRLVGALPAHARLILLGDRNQLASVEAGAILGDMCGPQRAPAFSRAFAAHVGKLTGDALEVDGASTEASIADCVVELRRNYRYPERSGIAVLAQAINDGDAHATLAALAGGGDAVARFASPPKGALGAALGARVAAGYGPYLEASEPHACFAALGKFRVLAAHRRGPHGVEKLNPLIAAALEDDGLVATKGSGWYVGRPVLVTENEYQVGLFNGDVGVVLRDPEEEEGIRVFFEGPGGGLRKLAPSRLPPHETVFAMTVHKAQGSEFDEVAVVLPEEVSPVLTRELLYTAVTRPKVRVAVFGGETVIAAAVGTPVERASGLRERLWGSVRSSR